MKKLIPKSRFTGRNRLNPDSLKERERYLQGDGKNQNLALYSRAEAAWMGLSPVRQEYMRNRRYVLDTDGGQWSDFVEDENGNLVREKERIAKRTGGVVLQNNHMIKIVNALTGIYDKTATMPVCFARKENADQKSQMMTRALTTNWDNNEEKDILSEQFFQMILGAVSLVKELWAEHDGVDDSYTYKTSLQHAFWEMEGSDPRHWDISMIGEFRDYTLGELAARYAESEYDYNQLAEIYRPYANEYSSYMAKHEFYEESWNTPMANNLCRVYEIWTKEHKPGIRCKDIMDTEQPLYHIDPKDLYKVKAENARRLEEGRRQGIPDDDIPLIEYQGKGLGYKIYEYWHFWALAPDGRIITDYDSPYEHGSHPYTIKIYLYSEGKPVPFISCIRDQQRYINRLITLNDLLINSTIKGLKLIPKDLVPEHMTERQFAKRAVELDGWVFYEPKNRATNAVPQVITQNSTNIGIHDLLQVELNSISDITNVSGALQGKTPSAGTSAQRYLLESQNSTTSIATLLGKFSRFENEVARKKMKVIHQYYQEPRNISVQQGNGYTSYEMYDPVAVKDIDFDCRIAESAEAPVARMLNNEKLEQWAAAGWIDLQDLLSYGYYPNLQELRQKIAANQEAVGMNAPAPGQGGVAGPAAVNANNQTRTVVPGADQNTVKLMERILGRTNGTA